MRRLGKRERERVNVAWWRRTVRIPEKRTEENEHDLHVRGKEK